MSLKNNNSRIPALDFIRGLLIFMMMFYHLFWDLGYFGYIDIYTVVSGIGLLIAQFIGASFIFLSGISMSLLFSSNQFSGRVFLIKLLKICSVSALITLVTWFINSQNFIYFGILHLLSVCYLLAYPILKFGNRFTVQSISTILFLIWIFELKFNISPFWAWTGLSQEIPNAFDFYPLIPWAIFFLFGILSSNYIVLFIRKFASGDSNKKFALVKNRLKIVPWAGRNSLLIYICHQPLFFTLFFFFNTLVLA